MVVCIINFHPVCIYSYICTVHIHFWYVPYILGKMCQPHFLMIYCISFPPAFRNLYPYCIYHRYIQTYLLKVASPGNVSRGVGPPGKKAPPLATGDVLCVNIAGTWQLWGGMFECMVYTTVYGYRFVKAGGKEIQYIMRKCGCHIFPSMNGIPTYTKNVCVLSELGASLFQIAKSLIAI